MARPQGIHSPLMVPLGSSIEHVVTNPINVAAATFVNALNLPSQSGVYLGMGAYATIGGSNIGVGNVGERTNIDNLGFDATVEQSAGGFRGVIRNDNELSFFPRLKKFNSSITVQAKSLLDKSGAPDNAPVWATAWYATRFVPLGIQFRQPLLINLDFGTTLDTYELAGAVVNGSGFVEYIALSNLSVRGLLNTWLKITVDDVVKEYDLGQVAMLPTLSIKREAMFPVKFRFFKNFKVEAKDDTNDTSDGQTRRVSTSYSLDI